MRKRLFSLILLVVLTERADLRPWLRADEIDGLVAGYPLNGDAKDVSGAHDGTLYSPTQASDRFGYD